MTDQLESNSNVSAFSHQGRFGRFNFLAWNMLLTIIFLMLALGVMLFTPFSIETILLYADSALLQLITWAMNLIWLYFFFIFSIKRLHDLDHSGWLSLLNLVPIVNFFFWLYLISVPGSLASNQYGPKRETATWESILASIHIVLLSLFALFFIAALTQLSSFFF